MKISRERKPGNAKGEWVQALAVSVFAMLVLSGLMLLLLAFVLYKFEPGETVISIGVVTVYVIAGIAGGVLAGRMMREQKFLWGLAAGMAYFVLLFVCSAVMRGGIDMEPVKLATTFVLCGASGMAGGMIS